MPQWTGKYLQFEIAIFFREGQKLYVKHFPNRLISLFRIDVDRHLIISAMQNFAEDQVPFHLIWRWMVDRGKTNASLDLIGNTALHLAAQSGVSEIVEIILDFIHRGSETSPHILNRANETSLAIAISAHRVDVVRSFITLSDRCEPSSSNQHQPPFLAFTSPLYRAFKVMLNDGRFNETGFNLGDVVDYNRDLAPFLRPNEDIELDPEELKEHRDFCRQLCIVLPDWGYPLHDETWLDHEFDDFLLGAKGPVEFRDVSWEKLLMDAIDAARETFKWLRTRRQQPMSLKSAARLTIRSAIYEKKRESKMGDRGHDSGSLPHLIRTTGLPKNLQTGP